MCGLFGYVTRDREFASRIDLPTALRALRHRGPDGHGCFESSQAEPLCGLAHTRLSIIDTSVGGQQPMTTADGRFTIVYNGEIFNFADIRADLGRAGAQFRSRSDTEVLLAAFAHWGPGCLDQLRGMFAFAIWDERERALFLARDRLGIKPLYFVRLATGLAFASELRTLLATGMAARKLSREGVRSYLGSGSVADPCTILDGVESLEPGCWIRLRADRLEQVRYWSPPLGQEQARPVAPDELSARLEEAVRLRLIADVPVGVFLSGGIDSASVLALARRAGGPPLHAFTVTFGERDFDEGAIAAQVAERFGCPHTRIHLSASRALAQVESGLRALDQPSADGINTYLVAKGVSETGLKVALSGLGADELFGGYAGFRHFGRALALGRTLAGAPRGIAELAARAARAGAASGRLGKLAGLLLTAGEPQATYDTLRAMFLPAQRSRLMGEHESARPRVAPAMSRPTLDPVNLYSHLELTHYLRNTLLRDTDAMSMAHSLEVRVPFLDHRLVETVANISGPQKIAPGLSKPLLTACVPELPESVRKRRKQGFVLPWAHWFRGELRPWLQDLLLGDGLAQVSLLEPKAVHEVWRSFLAGEHFMTHSRVWCLAALVGWCRANDVSG